MAAALVNMARAALGTTSATLYTVPGTNTAIVTDITLCNTNTTDTTVTLTIDGIAILSAYNVLANDTVDISVRQVVAANKIIAGLASATGVNIHISGAIV